MKTTEYLKTHGLDALIENYAIKVREYDDLIVLNYNQIESPKTDPIVMECRGLILERDTYRVVCRRFDRFFNYGEAPETMTHLDTKKARVFDKVDGSLIGIYHYEGHWYAATRGTAYAEAECGWGGTFFELVLYALNRDTYEGFDWKCDYHLNPETTYIFEITSPENRIVTRYKGYTLHYLAARHNETGEYLDEEEDAIAVGATLINEHRFDTIEHCIEAAHSLPDLKEGYVIYQDGAPICKIKSPTYMAIHAIRGEGLTPKRAMELIVTGEFGEYLFYFPEDEPFFTPYIDALTRLFNNFELVWKEAQNIEDQKEFALAVKDYSFSSVMFTARKKRWSPYHTFNQMDVRQRVKLLDSWMQQ